MRWPTIICLVATISVTIADTNETNASTTEPSTNLNETSTTPTEAITKSTEDTRPKRHLSTLINVKKAILGKIFGSSAPAKSYRLYRIPGHDNILVKAVPIQSPENDGEIPIEAPVNPTNAIIESYLGTRTPNETLKALDGVKNLLESGILTNDAVLNKLLVPVPPPKIVYRVPQISSVYPPVFRAPLAIETQPGKPCAVPLPLPLEPRPVFVKTPLRVIPEAPVLPPLSSLPEVLMPRKPVLFEERPELLDIRRVEIPDYRPVQVSKIPSNPFVQNGFEYLYKVPVVGRPLYPGFYSYEQFNKDGTVTQYTDSKLVRPVARPAILPPAIVERVQVISEKIAPKKPIYVKVPGSGYSYHQVKSDGFINTYGSRGKIPQLVIPEGPKFANVPVSLVEPVFLGKNPAEYGPVRVEKISGNTNGFSYHQYHNDGSVSLFGDGSKPLARPAVLPSIVADRIITISEKITGKKPHETTRTPEVLVQKPEGDSGYSYHQINNDESVTTFTGDGKKPLNVHVISESSRFPTLHGSDVVITEINKPEFGPVHVHKIPKNSNGFAYHQVHSDGSATTFTGSDVITPVVLPNIPDFTEAKRPEFGPVHVEKIPKNPNGFSYHQVYSDGSETIYSGADQSMPPSYTTLFLNRPGVTEIKHPSFGPVMYLGKHPSGFSYQQVNSGSDVPIEFSGGSLYDDGSAMVYGSANGPYLQEPPKLSTVVPGKPEISNKHEGFSYQQVHDDGSVTTYTGSDVETPGAAYETAKPGKSGYSYHLIDDEETVTTISGLDGKRPDKIIDSHVQATQRPILHPLVADRLQTISDKMNEGRIPVGNAGYSYHQISQGSVSTISGAGDKTTVPEPPKLSSLLNNKVTVTDVKIPQQTSSSQGGFSYQQSNRDGSVTTFTESDSLHKDTDKSTPSDQLVIIGSIVGHGAQRVEAFDVTDLRELQNNTPRGFSYQQINSGDRVFEVESTPAAPSSNPITVTNGNSATLEEPKTPCINKCVGTTKVTFPIPVVSTYEYQQLVRSNPNKKFTVVNIEDGLLRKHQESAVSVSPVTPSHITRRPRPALRRRTRPTTTESSLSENPIIVPEQSGFSYKQTSSDGSTTKIEGSDQRVTVSVSGEVHKTVHRGDIPE